MRGLRLGMKKFELHNAGTTAAAAALAVAWSNSRVEEHHLWGDRSNSSLLVRFSCVCWNALAKASNSSESHVAQMPF